MRTTVFKWLSHVLMCALVFGLAFGFVRLVSAQAQAPIGPPLEEKAEGSSMMLLKSEPFLSVNDRVLRQRSSADEPRQTEKPDDPATASPDGSQSGRSTAHRADTTPGRAAQTARPGGEPKGGGAEDKGNGGGQGDGDGGAADREVEIFVTDIVSGSTVKDPVFPFAIERSPAAAKQGIAILSVNVSLNGSEFGQYVGSVRLQEGKNEIVISVDYRTADGSVSPKPARGAYTVTLNRGELQIVHRLSDMTVGSNPLAFDAYAELGGRRLAGIQLTVACNGVALAPVKGVSYEAPLTPGSNTITLSASYEDLKPVSQAFTIVYDTDWFNTDLTGDREVTTETFDFYAGLKRFAPETARMNVSLNGKTITNADGHYSVDLNPQAYNTIRLTITDSGRTVGERAFSIYCDKTGTGEGADPTLEFSGGKGPPRTVSSASYTLNLKAYDFEGQRIYPTGENKSGIEVKLNGAAIPTNSGSDGNAWTTYFLALQNGDNGLEIYVRDTHGNYATYHYAISCNAVKKGDPIGTATISVEATTVGLGYLVPPTEVTIYEGENAVYVLARELNKHGFEYNYSGSADAGFYLAHLIRNGITKGASIPEDLAALVQNAGYVWNSYSANSLGQFDFTNGSGWMYQVDGSYPGYSMSDCFLQDGQTLRVRFTIALGSDIGGGGVGGGGGNFGGEW